MNKPLFILIYGFAFSFHGLMWLNFWLENDREAQAVITMGFGLLLIWEALMDTCSNAS